MKELKESLAKLDLDFVFLQETSERIPERLMQAENSNPLEHLADELWDYFIYGKNAIYSSGSHGNAILSRYPFQEWNNFDISNHPLEKRSLLVGTPIIRDKMPLTLCCTHLDLTSWGRKRQIQKISRIFKEEVDPACSVFFCGDFNERRKTVLRAFQDAEIIGLESAATFPSFFPVFSLDRVFLRRAQARELKVLDEPHWKRFSDHLPIYVEVEIEEY